MGKIFLKLIGQLMWGQMWTWNRDERQEICWAGMLNAVQILFLDVSSGKQQAI